MIACFSDRLVNYNDDYVKTVAWTMRRYSRLQYRDQPLRSGVEPSQAINVICIFFLKVWFIDFNFPDVFLCCRWYPQCLPVARVRVRLGTPWSPPSPLSRVWGHVEVKLLVPQKVIQKSSSTGAFTVLNYGVGRRSVNAGRWPLSRPLGCPANGTSTLGSTSL